MNSDGELGKIFQGLTELKASLTRIESALRGAKGNNNHPQPAQPCPTLLINISRTSGQRFPFHVDLTGVINTTVKVHPVRLAILIVLVRDTQDRATGGSGIADQQSIALGLSKALGDEVNLDALKGAWFRFENDFVGKLAQAPYKLEVQKSKHLMLKHEAQEIADFPVEISSKDPLISRLLDEVVPSSPFAKARTRKVLYVPGGPDGFDRLFLDLFNHSHQVHETSLFFKPSISTYPAQLLNFIRASEEDKKRREILLEGLATGRCSFDEVLNRRTLRRMITYTNNRKFLYYPPQVTQEHVELHLMELIRMVSEYKRYRLILTDKPMPFLLGLFDIYYAAEPECYTIFFKQMVAEHDPDINAFVINDRGVFKSVMNDVIGWIMADPKTLKDEREVVEELTRTLTYLRETGPIREDVALDD